MSNFNTAYDDVFRTLLVDCRELIIPVVNEVFHTNYIGTENVVLHENEIFMRQQNSEIMQQTLVVRFPESAVIYLRHNESIPDVFEICIHTPNGSISYHVPTLKVQQYDIETIFEKNLLFLIPFYIFTYEKQFSEINDNEEKLEALKREYAMITYRLDRLVRNCVINEYIKKTICEMSERVIAKLAVKYDSIRKEVTSIMGGKVLEYEAKDILRKGKKEAYLELVKDGLLSIEEAAKRADMTLEELQKELKKA